MGGLPSDSEPATPAEELPPSQPTSPSSPESSDESTPLDAPSSASASETAPGVSPGSTGSAGSAGSTANASSEQPPRRVPSLRAISDPQNTGAPLNPSSSVTGLLSTARRPTPSASSIPSDLLQKARALQEQRLSMGFRGPGSPVNMNMHMNMPQPIGPGGIPANFKLPPGMGRPIHPGFPKSAPAVPGAVRKAPGLSERRAMKLGSLSGSNSPSPAPTPKLADLGEVSKAPALNGEGRGSKFSDFSKYIDTEKGWITFEGAATITRTGVNFANGQTFSISLDEIEVLDELGKGNYGTVYKVRHARPKAPRFGQGLSGFRKTPSAQSPSEEADAASREISSATSTSGGSGRTTSGVVMAMKEIRLELDEAKFTTILKELVILHECVSPYIIDFYGAFFQEGAVYMCIEYMDGGSIDKLYAGGIPESVLRKITYAAVVGLKTLKEDHNIIHRDVKPTNILVNTRGQVKICDFGVSGNLVASMAKTNIGCQSYMAPERISGGGVANGTYSVQSDIWSLGLTIIECAMGRYPYPPEVSSTIFGQLSVSSPFAPALVRLQITNILSGHRRRSSPFHPCLSELLPLRARLRPLLPQQDSLPTPHLPHAPRPPVDRIPHQTRNHRRRR